MDEVVNLLQSKYCQPFDVSVIKNWKSFCKLYNLQTYITGLWYLEDGFL